jgi:tetratricopeptide (TPR) repeat protein
MTENRSPKALDANALMALAEAGGPGAALAARRAAAMWEQSDPAKARRAMALAVQLAPLAPAARLGLARMAAEAGDIEAAAAGAKEVLSSSTDPAAQGRAAFMLGELARNAGAHTDARNHYERSLKIYDAQLTREPGAPDASRWYARARGRIAEMDASAQDFARAKNGAEGALSLLHGVVTQTGETPELAADIADAELRLGALELDANQPSSARRRFSEAIGRYEALAVIETDEPHWRAVLSDAWALAAEADYARGAAAAAREAMDKSLQARLRLAARDPNEAWALAGTWRVRAALRAALGDATAAAESMQQARAVAERVHAADRQAEAPARFLTHTLLDQADHALRANEVQVAREAASEARRLSESFAASKGANPDWLADASACWDRLGEVARASGASTRDAFARAVELRRMACDRAPGAAKHARALAAALVKQGDAALETQDNATARAAFGESAMLRMKLMEAAPDDRTAVHALAVALERLGLAAQAMGDLGAAREAWEEELALAFRLFQDDDLEGIRFCAIVESHLAAAGGPDAESHRKAALERFDVLARANSLTEREAAVRKKLWGR